VTKARRPKVTVCSRAYSLFFHQQAPSNDIQFYLSITKHTLLASSKTLSWHPFSIAIFGIWCAYTDRLLYTDRCNDRDSWPYTAETRYEDFVFRTVF